MKVMNQEIKVTANYSARTFTIRTFVNGKLSSKYRTHSMSKEDFESENNNTENDWRQFLKGSDYYLVK